MCATQRLDEFAPAGDGDASAKPAGAPLRAATVRERLCGETPLGSALGKGGRRGGFTLIELVVVVGIIALLAVVTLPGVSRMMEDSRLADTHNKLRGLLKSARSRALHTADGGLFFYVDDGVQWAVFIEKEPPDTTPGSADELAGVVPDDARIRYRVVEDSGAFSFAKPFRVMPRSVLDRGGNPPEEYVWSTEDLVNEHYRNLTADTMGEMPGAHNHRNFFTVLFSKDGRLLMESIVLIHDPPRDEGSGVVVPGPGGVTGLIVDDATDRQDAFGATDSLMGTLPGMIVANGQPPAAVNFPSVDGLLVYDDSVFREFPDTPVGSEPDKRRYLIDSAAPVYISPQTGAVILGPKGESEAPQ